MERKALLEIRGLTKSFGGLRALDDVTLDVQKGEILGLIGPNGSGKTTLINVVTGLLRPDRGEIRFLGQVLEPRPWVAARLGITRTFQTPRFFANLSVLENLLTVAWFHFGNRSRALGKAKEVLSLLEMTDLAGMRPGDLTIQQRKRLGLAMALVIEPKLLFLDEPMAGLNPVEMKEEAERIRQVNDLGVTVVYIEHIMAMVRLLCRRVVALNHGKVIAEGTPDQVLSDPSVIEAYLGGEVA